LTPLEIEPVEAEELRLVQPAEILRPVSEPPVVENKEPEKTFGPIDLTTVKVASDLARFGLDHLKAELNRVGLKCGGTLDERAERLFLLKCTPYDKLEKQHKSAGIVSDKPKKARSKIPSTSALYSTTAGALQVAVSNKKKRKLE